MVETRTASEITTVENKLQVLKDRLQASGSVVVAFSGGIDSTFLAVIAMDVLGDKVLAVTADSPSLSRTELKCATELARKLGLKHRVIKLAELEREDYRANSPRRCFYCKDELFTRLKRIATDEGYFAVVCGSNVDDIGDFRPGMEAAVKHGVTSPLIDAGFTKNEIRLLACKMGIPNWDKPAQACLASRIPYGIPVTAESLYRIARAEEYLRKLGFKQVRVRHHGTIARIEISTGDFDTLIREKNRKALVETLKSLGYAYVTLDLEGFRSGSLNEVLGNSRNNENR